MIDFFAIGKGKGLKRALFRKGSMHYFTKLFSRAPFDLLEIHMEKVIACLVKLDEVLLSFKEGNLDQAGSFAESVSELEHEADLIKNDIQTLEPSKIDLPKTESRSLKFLEREQVDRLVSQPDTSKEEGMRDRAIMELLFSTGLRVSELAKLNHDQINFERREFGVIGKGGRARIVFISDRAADWVKRWYAAISYGSTSS